MFKVFKQRPFIRLLPPLILGIWFGLLAHMPDKLVCFLAIITVISVFGLIFMRKQSANFKYRGLFGIHLYVFLALLGFLLVTAKTSLFKKMEIFGGIVLILIGVKILLEHLTS